MRVALYAAGVALAVGVLPGGFLFRLPLASREERASIPADERVFWYALLSACWSVAVALGLASLSSYSLTRLLGINLGVCGAIALAFRGRLLWRGSAAGIDMKALLPLALVALCIWRFFPAAEYIIGGQDPGVYVNEGISIARTGTMFRHDAVVADVPEPARDLFFRSHGREEYYGLRFMGIFITNPATGDVMPGFPHLFPASVTIGYGLAGVRG